MGFHGVTPYDTFAAYIFAARPRTWIGMFHISDKVVRAYDTAV
jgi:hypothetical protein